MSVAAASGLLAFSIVQTLFALILTIMLIKRRSEFPIKGRLLIPVIGAIWFCSISTLITTILIFSQSDCQWITFGVGICISGVVDLYYVRFFSLWYSYNLTNEQLKFLPERYKRRSIARPSASSRSNSGASEIVHIADKETRFMRYKKLNTSPVLNTALAIIMFVRLIWAYYWGRISPMITASVEKPSCYVNQSANTAANVWYIVYVLCVLYWAYSLRRFDDALKIRFEMYCFAAWGVFGGATIILAKTLAPPYIGMYIIFAVLTYLPIISGVIPLYRAKKHSQSVCAFDPGQHKTLEQQLQSRDGYDAFREYLQKEFSVENLLFYEGVEKYRQKHGVRKQTSNTRAAVMIYLYFVSDSAPLQVNISSQCRLQLFRRLGVERMEKIQPSFGTIKSLDDVFKNMNLDGIQVDIDIFDVAQRECLELMETHCYIRYRLQHEIRKVAGLMPTEV